MSHGDVTKIALIHRHQLNFPSALSLLVVKQWINDTSWAGGNETTKWYSFPITFNKQVLVPVLSDTNGGIAENGTEGAIITEYYTSGLTAKCSWTNGFADKNISIIIVGF